MILVCIRWYAAYPLSYQHLEEITEECGISVDRSSINRWAIGFPAAHREDGPENKRPVGGSSRMDETDIMINGVWKYLHYDGDKQANTVDFLLTAKRHMTQRSASSARKCQQTVLLTWS